MQHRVHKTKTNKTKTQHNICWIPPYTNKQKEPKQDMNPLSNNWRKGRIEHRLYADILTDSTTRSSEHKDT